MPVSRPLLLALVGAVLVGAVFFATRGLSGTAAEPASDSATPVTPAPEPAGDAGATPKSQEPAAPKSEPKQQKSEPAEPKSEPKQQNTEAAQPKSEPKQQKAEAAQPKQQQSDTVRTSRPAKQKAPVLSSREKIARAVKSGDVVVLFFRQRGADDSAVAAAVKAQRGRKDVAVFILPVGQAPKYAKYGGASVVRAPSIVVLGRDRKPLLY
jgi:outer membrane biosynthesis protein TonB